MNMNVEYMNGHSPEELRQIAEWWKEQALIRFDGTNEQLLAARRIQRDHPDITLVEFEAMLDKLQ